MRKLRNGLWVSSWCAGLPGCTELGKITAISLTILILVVAAVILIAAVLWHNRKTVAKDVAAVKGTVEQIKAVVTSPAVAKS